MRSVPKHRAAPHWPAVLLLLLLWVIGCSGITAYQPRNHREEGPERGVFTGSKGELTIPLPQERAPENKPVQPNMRKTL